MPLHGLGALACRSDRRQLGLTAAYSRKGGSDCSGRNSPLLAAGALYLRIVAAFYGIFGMEWMRYFAGQGARQGSHWPGLAGTARADSFGHPLSGLVCRREFSGRRA